MKEVRLNSLTSSLFVYSLFTTAATITINVKWCAAIVVFEIGREEFVNGETDSSECVAGIFGIATTFFCGYAEIISGYEHLNVTFKLNNGENTQGNLNSLFTVASEITVKTTTDITGYTVTTIAQGIATIANSADFSVKHYGVNALHLGFGVRVGNGHLLV